MRLKNSFNWIAILFLSSAFVACNNAPSNEELQRSINDSLQANTGMKNVSAAVADGAVTLTGTCDGDNCVAESENKVKGIDGVKSVQNNVTMAPQSTDLTLRTQVQDITSRYAGVQADVANGAVVLRGSIERGKLQSLMSELSGVQATKIDNQLVVK